MPTEKELMLKQADAETTYQKKLTAGTNITIDPVTNIISSAGGGSTVQYTDNTPNGESVGILAINGQSHPVRIPRLSEGTGITINKDITTNVYTISLSGGGGGTTKTYMGETNPDELVGEDGDLYFKYHKIETDIPTELTLPSLPDDATVPFPITNFNSYDSFTFYYTDLNREPHSRTVNMEDIVISDSPADESPSSSIYTGNSYCYVQATRSTNGEGLVLRVCGNCLYKLEANVTEVDLGIDKSYAKVEDTWLPSGEQVEANPEETSQTPLTKIKIDGVTYYIAAGGSAEIVPLTKAEWDALPASKYTDNILYLITDSFTTETIITPNPEGEATDTLTKLQIDETIYSLAGGSGAAAVEKTQAEYDALTPAQKTNGAIYMVQAGEQPQDTSGTFVTGSARYEKVEINCGFRPDYIEVTLPFSSGDTTAIYDASVSITTSTWEIPQEGNKYTIELGSETGETGITDITDTGFKFRCNASNTRGVTCTFTASKEGQESVNKIYYMGTEYANTNGGSGGGGDGYEETVLWTGAATASNTILALSDSITNYDDLLIYGATIFDSNGTITTQLNTTQIIPVSQIEYGVADEITKGYMYNVSHGQAIRRAVMIFTDASHFVVSRGGENDTTECGFTKVVGIKYGSGGGSGSDGKITTLAESQSTIFVPNDTITLSDSINNYDLIICFHKYSNGEIFTSTSISVEDLMATTLRVNTYYGDVGYNYINYVDETTLTNDVQSNVGIYKIIGIKFGSGGGTDVIPNPEGTPTDELHSLQIGNDIYEIVGGGGGGGNASLDAITLYDTPITTTGTYTLTDNYNNYDFIGFKAGNGSTETDIRLYAVKDIQDSMNDNLVITNNVTNSWFNFTINENELTIPGKTVSTIYSVIGYKIKGGGGSGEGYTETLLYQPQTAFTTGVITLSDDISNYDALIFRTKFHDGTRSESIVNSSEIEKIGYIANPSISNEHVLIKAYSGNYFRVVRGSETDDKVLNFFHSSGDESIYEIYGISYGSGGGSSIIPNPEEEPTDTLNSVKIDGTVYNIESGSEGEGVEIYSEDEYIIGKWLDGKKLYQRTVHLSNIAIPNGTSTIKYTDDSIEYAWVEKGIFREGRTDAVIPSIITNLTFDQSNTDRFGVGIDDVNRNYIKFFASDTFSANVNRHLYITIRYTKTVETPAPAWGGSVTNNYANFIDTDNVIQAFTQISDTSEHTYTATEDCIITYYVASQGDTYIKINNVLVGGNYSQAVSALCSFVAVKKGQTFSFQQSYAGSSSSGYTVYGISYGSGGSSNGSSVHYSTTEQVMGTWIDGKPLYQKTYENLNIGTVQNYSLTLSDLQNIEYLRVVPEGSQVSALIPFPYSHYNSNNNISYFIDSITNGVPTLAIRKGYEMSSQSNLQFLTIQYTKTTD